VMLQKPIALSQLSSIAEEILRKQA